MKAYSLDDRRVSVGLDKICHCCGKEFLAQAEWIYKISYGNRKTWFCRYTCYRKHKKS